MESNKDASPNNGNEGGNLPADERALSEPERNILNRRFQEVQRHQAALQAAAAIYQETVILLTGGDFSLTVDVRRGMIVRKDG